jgi:hypothetical protein
MISDPVARKKIRDALQEISNSMTRVEAERDLIKEIISNVSEEHKIKKKAISKMARIYHKQNFDQEVKEFQDLEALYDDVTGRKTEE